MKSERLDSLLRPNSIAIIGASENPNKWGHRMISNTIALGYQGRLWAVNPRHDVQIAGSEYAAHVSDVEDGIDLAVAAVPRAAALDVVSECAAQGVRNLVLPASGFGEMGGDGIAQESQILEIAREENMRILGPNCFGLYSASGAFNVTPFPQIPCGDVALISQSGNITGHAFIASRRYSLGFSQVVGIGNQLDISFADVAEWLARDNATSRVALYLEGLRESDAEVFLDSLASCRDAGKPIVVVKAGGSDAGRAVASSHTGSLTTEDRVWEEVLRNLSAIRVHSVAELCGVLSLAGLERPDGRRVAVITDGGGDSVLAVDGVERHGLELANFPEKVQHQLDEVIPPDAPRIEGRNPITLDTAGGVDEDPEVIPRCLNVLEGVEGIDVVVVGGLYGTYERVRTAELRAADQILAMAQRGLAIVVHSPIRAAHSEPLRALQQSGVPVFDDMDHLQRALDLWLPAAQSAVAETKPTSSIDRSQWAPAEAYAMLTTAGVSLPKQVVISCEEELMWAADTIGFPLCLKTADPTVVHKSDIGGVQVGITGVKKLRAAARQIVRTTGSSELLVMPSLTPGMEIMMGARSSPQFGPIVVVGRGGIWTEMEADTVTFVGQVDHFDFLNKLARLRCAPMLLGGRGQPPLDVGSLLPLAQALVRVVDKNAQVSIDLNPVFLYKTGCGVADLRVVEQQSGG